MLSNFCYEKFTVVVVTMTTRPQCLCLLHYSITQKSLKSENTRIPSCDRDINTQNILLYADRIPKCLEILLKPIVA